MKSIWSGKKRVFIDGYSYWSDYMVDDWNEYDMYSIGGDYWDYIEE